MLVRTHDRTVDEQVVELGILGQRDQDLVPEALDAPAAEPPEPRVSGADDVRKIAPGGAGAHDPRHRRHAHPVVPPGRAGRLRPV